MSSSTPRGTKKGISAIPHALADFLHTFPDDHPLQIALRTYALSLSLALGPTIIPLLTSPKFRKNGAERIKRILRRELGMSSFAFAMTVGVSGGAAIRRLWECLLVTDHDKEKGSETEEESERSPYRKMLTWLASLKASHKTFLSNVLSSSLAIALFHSRPDRLHISAVDSTAIPLIPPIANPSSKAGQAGGRTSITLDLTLLLFVRAMDSLAQRAILKYCEMTDHESSTDKKEGVHKRKRLFRTRLDALVFWACSARSGQLAAIPHS